MATRSAGKPSAAQPALIDMRGVGGRYGSVEARRGGHDREGLRLDDLPEVRDDQ